MPKDNDLGPAEREFEEALGRLRPVAALDRDRLMFEAGRRSQAGRLLAWRAVSLLFFIGIGLSLALRPAPQSVEPLIYVDKQSQLPLAVAFSAELPETSYLRLQKIVLAEGLQALPSVRGRASHAAQERLTIKGLLESSANGT
jgi:hypothetical protein